MITSIVNPNFQIHPLASLFPLTSIPYPASLSKHPRTLHAVSKGSGVVPNPDPNRNPDSDPEPSSKTRTTGRRKKLKAEKDERTKFPTPIPYKPRRGHKSEAAAVEDYVRNSLEKTFASIMLENSEVMERKESVMKESVDETGDGEEDGGGEGGMVVEEENPDWPLDADVGWGIRASEYFEKHPIRNVVGEDGVEIDWVGEMDDNLVKEINCLEWESFAFHPSPLIVLVFERYNGAAENWRVLKELEKAALVYWAAKDRLPPRTVKIDMNIERDLAYALKIKKCPQILFLRGNRILHREQEVRTAEELVQMIAHFYYNARKPSWLGVGTM